MRNFQISTGDDRNINYDEEATVFEFSKYPPTQARLLSQSGEFIKGRSIPKAKCKALVQPEIGETPTYGLLIFKDDDGKMKFATRYYTTTFDGKIRANQSLDGWTIFRDYEVNFDEQIVVFKVYELGRVGGIFHDHEILSKEKLGEVTMQIAKGDRTNKYKAVIFQNESDQTLHILNYFQEEEEVCVKARRRSSQSECGVQ